MSITIKAMIPNNSSRDNVIFIHGYTECSKCFSNALEHEPALSHFNLWTLDLPGFGNAPFQQKLTYTTLTSQLSSSIQALIQNNQTVIIGHSLGGTIALMTTNELINSGIKNIKVFCIDPLVTPEKKDSSSIAKANHIKSPIDYKTFATEYWASKCNNDLWITRYLTNLKNTPADALHLWANLAVQMLDNNTVLDTLKKLKNFVTIFCGDNTINTRNINAIQEMALPITWIKNSGHWPMLENSATFWQLINNELRKPKI